MFMMGVSFTFSLKSLDRRGATRMEMTRKIMIRSAKLFILGFFEKLSFIYFQAFLWLTIQTAGKA